MSIISGTLRIFEACWHFLRQLIYRRIFGSSPKPDGIPPSTPSSNEENKEHVKKSSNSLPIFALTIGIDDYCSQFINNLSGCVADADDVVDFLLETLDVPPANITNLRNEEATAAGMTSAFESLATDPHIPKDAIIFIFYAGHGSEALPPEGWSSNEVIQTLIPYDFDFGSGENPVATNGLADIKLSQLLEDIANKKGNKILCADSYI